MSEPQLPTDPIARLLAMLTAETMIPMICEIAELAHHLTPDTLAIVEDCAEKSFKDVKAPIAPAVFAILQALRQVKEPPPHPKFTQSQFVKPTAHPYSHGRN